MYEDPNINENGYIYGKWMTTEDTYTISCRGSVYCYLLVGSERALLIDTAYGEGNIRHFVEQITSKPIMVINTHEHFDHSGGNPWWNEVHASKEAGADIKKAFTTEMQEQFNKRPYPDYKVNNVYEGFQFDLGGGRIVEVLEIPAHCKSSIALLDKTKRILYTGDEVEAGQVLMFGKEDNERFKQHQLNMKKLKSRSSEFDFLCPAHNGNPINKKYIDDFITLSQQIIDRKEKRCPTTAGFGFSPNSGLWDGRRMVRAEFEGASFCYTVDK